MARPRIFVSSTYYDLRHIRSNMESFIESFGYDPILFESGEIPFHHDMTLADACYNEVKNSNIFVLIIGGRYGSADDDRKGKANPQDIHRMYETYNSVTKKEYETARNKDIPIFIFVEKNVKAEYETFKSNRTNDTIKYAHVDSVNIFKLLDDILLQRRNNYVKDFEKFEDISNWLREQWAGIFSDLLASKREDATLKDMSAKIAELNQVINSMKEYTQTILLQVRPDSKTIIDREEKKERTAKIGRFRQEPMISYLRREAHRFSEEANPLPTIRLFNAVEKSKDLADFVTLAKLPKELGKELLEELHDQALIDLMKLKKIYFHSDKGEEDENEEDPEKKNKENKK